MAKGHYFKCGEYIITIGGALGLEAYSSGPQALLQLPATPSPCPRPCPLQVTHCLLRPSSKVPIPPEEYNEAVFSPVSNLLWTILLALLFFCEGQQQSSTEERRVWGARGKHALVAESAAWPEHIWNRLRSWKTQRQIGLLYSFVRAVVSLLHFLAPASSWAVKIAHTSPLHSGCWQLGNILPPPLQSGLRFREPELELVLGPLPSFIPCCSVESFSPLRIFLL